MSAAAAPKIPTGVNMMLKSLGIQFDPSVIPEVVNAVKDVAQSLARLEANQKLIMKKLGMETDAGT